MRKIMDQVQGAYSVVCSIVGKGVIAFRDPHGIRPLCIGQGKTQKDAFMFASETAPFFSLGLESIGDVFPGEGAVTIEGGRESLFGKLREGLTETLSSLEDITSQGEILDVQSQVVEEADDEFLENGIVIGI